MDNLLKQVNDGSDVDGQHDHLEYLADLLGELQNMAHREGYRKLSRLLAISYAEAMREAQRRSA
jgi:hypothetical protein